MRNRTAVYYGIYRMFLKSSRWIQRVNGTAVVWVGPENSSSFSEKCSGRKSFGCGRGYPLYSCHRDRRRYPYCLRYDCYPSRYECCCCHRCRFRWVDPDNISSFREKILGAKGLAVVVVFCFFLVIVIVVRYPYCIRYDCYRSIYHCDRCHRCRCRCHSCRYRCDFQSTGYAILGDEEVRAKFGVRSSSLPDLFGLVGDAADNIPGLCQTRL